MSFTVASATPIDRLTTLLTRLVKHHGLPPLDEDGLAAFVAAPGVSLLFFPEDPERVPESWDVAAVLPDLVKHLPEPCRAGVVPPETGRHLRNRYGFKLWPALIFLRDGGYLGAIEGMKDWAVFVTEARQILARPASRPPLGLDIHVEGGSSSCH
jgi:hydrogenase-1 operon protein HyaE